MLSYVERRRVDAYRLLMADVYELAALSRRASEGIAAAAGVSVAQWHVLSVLSGGPATVPAVADRLGLTRQAVQRPVDRLLELGHVAATPNPTHVRSPLLSLTATGVDLLDELWSASEAPRAAASADLSEDELVAARTVVQAVVRGLRSNT